ncbi:MATE family efflux transporter [Marinisporobacter balticus]|uniref:Probable multidrug resistance protein NorM n=1 Tax=Marinisporobacter balticus TaxID=2018667 RepID=A0A4R2KQ38_9FIRM|nr:MATE family efflux transporter [Marinisporobacter balticus]TCO68725.1 MATE family multidrug resistance protein [Marinisporobacter balticus]
MKLKSQFVKEYMKVTIPFMFSTLTQPLLSATDTAVIGHLGSIEDIVGITLGSTLINTICWIFGFLRVCTTADSSRAKHSQNKEDVFRAIIMPAFLAFCCGVFILLMNNIILNTYILWINPQTVITERLTDYYRIIVLGIPFVFINYVILGWLMGQRRIRQSLIIQVFGNLLNIILDFIFVMNLNSGVKGVAVATLISQCTSLIIGVLTLKNDIPKFKQYANTFLDKNTLFRYLSMSRDLMFRTICLLIHNNLFVCFSSSFGKDILAANSLIIQCNLLISYLFEGIANGSSTFSGTSYTDDSGKSLKEIIRITTKAYLVIAFISVSALQLVGFRLWTVFTDYQPIYEICISYQWVVLIFPLISGIGLSYYGIFSGLGKTKEIALTTFLGLLGFIICSYVMIQSSGNTGLWIASLLFYAIRSIGLLIYIPKLYLHLKISVNKP